MCSAVFFFNDTATTEIYTLSLHDALPILASQKAAPATAARPTTPRVIFLSVCMFRSSALSSVPCRPGLHRQPLPRSEEHTSELQSPCNLVCRLLLEKKKTTLAWQPRTRLL